MFCCQPHISPLSQKILHSIGLNERRYGERPLYQPLAAYALHDIQVTPPAEPRHCQQLLSYLQGPIVIKPYTVATLPDAATYENCIIYVSNGTSNKRLAVSDGTQWRWPDGNIVT